jgi:hypothetical protein
MKQRFPFGVTTALAGYVGISESTACNNLPVGATIFLKECGRKTRFLQYTAKNSAKIQFFRKEGYEPILSWGKKRQSLQKCLRKIYSKYRIRQKNFPPIFDIFYPR